METFINVTFATLRMSAPLILVAMAGILSQQVGLLNIALEGLMLVGAFAAVVAAFFLGSTWGGVLVACLVATLLAAVFALFVIQLRANLIVAGLAVNFLALGATAYLLQVLFNTRGAFAPKGLVSLAPVAIPLLDRVPVLSKILSGHTPLVYASWLSVALTSVFLYRTALGTHIRAVGEHGHAVVFEPFNYIV